VAQKIGNKPATITATVMAFGLTRSTAPWRIASSRNIRHQLEAFLAFGYGLFQIQQHHDTKFSSHARERDDPTPVAIDRL